MADLRKIPQRDIPGKPLSENSPELPSTENRESQSVETEVFEHGEKNEGPGKVNVENVNASNAVEPKGETPGNNDTVTPQDLGLSLENSSAVNLQTLLTHHVVEGTKERAVGDDGKLTEQFLDDVNAILDR